MSDYMTYRRNHILSGRPLKEKKKYVIPKVSEKRKKKIDGGAMVGLNEWFAGIEQKHFKHGFSHCMECGAVVPLAFARAATAHLLPKKLFKSVATHPLNYLILGAGCGCHQKTDRVDKFRKMKVWPEAARRIKEMIPLLPFDELKYLSSQLLKALDETKTDKS